MLLLFLILIMAALSVSAALSSALSASGSEAPVGDARALSASGSEAPVGDARSIRLNTGALMPLVGLGTWQADAQAEAGAVRRAVAAALESGVRHIDCAAAYGNEREVGEAIADALARGVVGSRAELFITSKLWVTRAFPEEVEGALAATLADLRLDYVDLYLVHWPVSVAKGASFPPSSVERLGYDADRVAAVWRAMEAQASAGRARAIGTSNFSAKKLAKLLESARVAPAVNQIESHPALPQAREVAWAAARGIAVTAYSPLGSPARPARLVAAGDPAPLHDARVLAIAAKHAREPAQVLVRWQVQRGVAAIPKSATPARIAANADVFGFELDAEDLRALAALETGHRIFKGAAFVRDGDDWRALWDEDFLLSQPEI
jgi:alcohol dehydrogenase (NADP+)